MEVSFVLNGRLIRLTAEQVEAAVDGITPEPVRVHAVEIRGQSYPVKQVFELATGADRSEFTSYRARQLLNRLGFTTTRTGGR
jgi:hypothetical protein